MGGGILGGVGLERLPDSGRPGGIVTTSELAGCGIGKAAIRVLVRHGSLVPVRRGAYAQAAVVAGIAGPAGRREHLLRLAAALAVIGPGAAGSHEDAALVHGLDLLQRPPGDLVTVTRPIGRDCRRIATPVVRIRAAALPPAQVTARNGVMVTSVARTVVDLARSSQFRSGVVVADSALYRGKTTKAELDAVLEACPRWPGIERARQVVEFSDARSESPFESISRIAFRDGGLPPPDLQVWVGADDRIVGRVDFLWRQYATVAEADGAIKYADPDRARMQLRRDAALREAGFEVVHFSWRELTATPGQVIESIRAAFRRSIALRSAGQVTAGQVTALA